MLLSTSGFVFLNFFFSLSVFLSFHYDKIPLILSIIQSFVLSSYCAPWCLRKPVNAHKIYKIFPLLQQISSSMFSFVISKRNKPTGFSSSWSVSCALSGYLACLLNRKQIFLNTFPLTSKASQVLKATDYACKTSF